MVLSPNQRRFLRLFMQVFPDTAIWDEDDQCWRTLRCTTTP